jgi:Tfp pilus assembly protein PilF
MSDVPSSLATAIEFHQKGDLEAAIGLYQDVIDSDHENVDAWHLMGVVAHQRGNNDLAVKLLENAISLKDDVADFYSNMGMVRRALGDDGAADGAFRRAVEIDPSHAKALSNLAGLLRSNGAFSSAVDYARRAVRAGPDDPEAHNNLGNALKDSGGDWVEDAVASYRQALELTPDYALAHWNLSLALLSLGDYKEGFAEMAWRWQWTGFPARRREFEQPHWTGPGNDAGKDVGISNDNKEGKRILLHAEQGLGDTLHFMRYAAVVKALGMQVIFECPAALVPLVGGTDLVDELILPGDPLPAFECHAALLDLPNLCGTTAETIPTETAYVTVPADILEKWQARVNQETGFKIGLNWTGNLISPIERFRGLPPIEIEKLAGIKGVSWFSLQKGDPDEDAFSLPDNFPISYTNPEPLVEAAGLIQALDLVITSDTAMAHLAGALGKPVWVLLHHAPDWRWLIERSDSPWYPAARLFRQKQPGAWTPVFDDVKTALAEMLG